MQIETSLILIEYKQLLKQRKYKTLISRLQQLFQKLSISNQEFLYHLKMIEIQAINHLFARNIVKKFKYYPQTIEYLISLSIRNIKDCYIFVLQFLKSDNCFISNKLNNEQILINEELDVKSKRQNEKFIAILLNSVLYLAQMLSIYQQNLNLSLSLLQPLINSLIGIKFINIQAHLSKIRVLLYFAKSYYIQGQVWSFQQTQLLVQQIIQNLIEVIHKLNKALFRSKQKNNAKKVIKYEKMHQECHILLAITIIISNKSKMKLFKEDTAVLGINLLKVLFHSLKTKHNVIKKLMMPELYLQEQFLRYKIQKAELAKMVQHFYKQKIKPLQEINKTILTRKYSILDYYNNKQRKIFTKIIQQNRQSALIKTTINNKRNMNNIQQNISEKENGKLIKDTKKVFLRGKNGIGNNNSLIGQILLNEIVQNNKQYIQRKSAKISTIVTQKQFCKKIKQNPIKYPHQKHPPHSKSLLHITNTKSIKRKTYKNPPEPEPQNIESLLQRQKNEGYGIKLEKQKLKIKKGHEKLKINYNLIEDGRPVKKQLQQQLYQFKENIRKSQQDMEDRQVKKNITTINSKKKSEMFLQILWRNKNILGLKKIAQKVEIMKKKQVEKEMSNRLTSLINHRQRIRVNKFQQIARQILKSHIKLQSDTFQSTQIYFRQMDHLKKQIEANYQLGQQSIESVKTKLNRKIHRQKNVVDRYAKCQEVFKMKLKKLGSSNFLSKINPTTSIANSQVQIQ